LVLLVLLLGIVWCTVYLFACFFWYVQDFEQQLAGQQGK
jgi:hypothetical protein